MPLKLCVFLNNERTREVLARKQREEAVGEKQSSFAAPIYLMIDRSVELMASQCQRLQGKYTVDEWRFLIRILAPQNPFSDSPLKLSEVTGVIGAGLVSAGLPRKPDLYSRNVLDVELNWAILDVVERFHSAGDITADADGLKKLGILCKE